MVGIQIPTVLKYTSGNPESQTDINFFISGSTTVRKHHLGRAQEVQRSRVDGLLQRQRLRRLPRQSLRQIHQQQLCDAKGEHKQQIS